MSLFIKIQRWRGPARCVRLRGLCWTVGEDCRGVLTFDEPTRPFFSLYALDRRYLVKLENSAMSLDGALQPELSVALLPAHCRISGLDYDFAVTATPAEAEVGSCLDPAETETILSRAGSPIGPRAVYRVAGLSRSYPLYAGLRLGAGSHENDPIFIDLPGIMAGHCFITALADRVVIEEGAGAVTVDGRVIAGSAEIRSGAFVGLSPDGAGLEVIFPQA